MTERERKKEEKRSIIMLFVSICCVTCGYPVAPQNVLCNAHVTLEMPPYHGKGDHPVARLACEWIIFVCLVTFKRDARSFVLFLIFAVEICRDFKSFVPINRVCLCLDTNVSIRLRNEKFCNCWTELDCLLTLWRRRFF